MHEVDNIIYSFGGHNLTKKTNPPPPSTPPKKKKKKKKKRKKPVIHLGCHLHALFSVGCHGFEFLKFHSVTDDDIMTTGSFKGK